MVRRVCTLLALLVVASLPAWPQASGPAEIKVRVSTTDERPAPKHLRVDPQALLLLAQMHLQSGKMEEAAVQARKVHDAPHEAYAVAHLIAARALEARNLSEEAAAEYKLFLQEAPNSPSAPKARAALDKLTTRAN
jgi:hypothetical protein